MTERTADILHVDMDCFFAAVEVRLDPSLSGLPVIVGGTGARGVVASASYEARAFGVRSAMPTAEARRLCPDGVYLNARHGEYQAVSRELMALFMDVSPLVEPLSLDEAFLDVSGSHRLLGESLAIASALRERVQRELALTCSIGIGSSKLIAKLASKAAKPEIGAKSRGSGLLLVDPALERQFLDPLPVRALPGAGPRTCERLARLGISTVGELAEIGAEALLRLFGKSHGAALYELANGHDPRPVTPSRPARSIGHEQTFAVDDYERSSLEAKLCQLAASVASRLRDHELVGKTVSLKVRFADFSTISRAQTLKEVTASASVISEVACLLLDQVELDRGVRLIGVQIANIEEATLARAAQLSLFGSAEDGGSESADERRETLDLTADAIRQRFGPSALSAVTVARRKGRLPPH